MGIKKGYAAPSYASPLAAQDEDLTTEVEEVWDGEKWVTVHRTIRKKKKIPKKEQESKPVSEIISAQSSSYQYAMPGDTIMYAEFESPHIIIPSDDFCSTITSEGDSDGFPKDTVINVESSTLSPEKPVTQ